MYSFSRIFAASSQIPHSCVCEWLIFSQDRSTYFPGSRIGRSIVGRYMYIAHRHMNVEIGTVAVQLLFWEYLFWIFGIVYLQWGSALQRQNTEISKPIFPEKEYRGLSPNFHIHASVSNLYIPTIGLPILVEEICRLILGLYKSLTDSWMLKLGLRPRYSQKRNI